MDTVDQVDPSTSTSVLKSGVLRGDTFVSLDDLKGRALKAGFVEEVGGVEEAVEVEAASAGEEGADLGGALLLARVRDPDAVR